MANRSFLGKKTKQKAIPERGELHLLMAGERLAATAVQKREREGEEKSLDEMMFKRSVFKPENRFCTSACVCVAEP